VGRGGVNSRSDTKIIQQLLNDAMKSTPGFRPLAVDGIAGPKTNAAIEMYQRKALGWADGRVDPGGKTLASLNQKAGAATAVPPKPQAGSINGDPRWITIAKQEIGTKEIKGSRHNSRIVEYHDTTGKFGNDEAAWCSSFVNWVMIKAGYSGTNSAAAISWRNWGKKLDQPAYGAIAVIDWDGPGPGWKGHVGFVVGKSGSSIQLLGGNQSDAVNVKNFGTGKIIAYVVPANYDVPQNAYQLTNYGAGGQNASMAGTR
jgi:uncharacterized protein (TIGR02594 family)